MDSENKTLKVALLILGLVAMIAVVGYALSSWQNMPQEKQIPPSNMDAQKTKDNAENISDFPSFSVSGPVVGLLTEESVPKNRWISLGYASDEEVDSKNQSETSADISVEVKKYRFVIEKGVTKGYVREPIIGEQMTIRFSTGPSESGSILADEIVMSE